MHNDNIIGLHTLSAEIERYDSGSTPAGRRAVTLIKTDDLRVVLVTMQEDTILQEHSAPGTITIHALSGQFGVVLGDDEIILDAGTLLSLAPDVVHTVRAVEPGAFLLTIAWAPNRTHDVVS